MDWLAGTAAIGPFASPTADTHPTRSRTCHRARGFPGLGGVSGPLLHLGRGPEAQPASVEIRLLDAGRPVAYRKACGPQAEQRRRERSPYRRDGPPRDARWTQPASDG